jgi:hypothetical protein
MKNNEMSMAVGDGFLIEDGKLLPLEVTIKQLMRVFKVARVWTLVSEAKDTNVGEHLILTSLLAMKFTQRADWEENRRNKMIIVALTHDLHESMTGDVMPAYKTDLLRATEDHIDKLLEDQYGKPSLGDKEYRFVKFCDRLSFLWEMRNRGSAETSLKERAVMLSLHKHVQDFPDKERRVAETMIEEILAGKL